MLKGNSIYIDIDAVKQTRHITERKGTYALKQDTNWTSYRETDLMKEHIRNSFLGMPLIRASSLVLLPQQCKDEPLVVSWDFLGHSIFKMNTVPLVVHLFDVLQIFLSSCYNHTSQTILISSKLFYCIA